MIAWARDKDFNGGCCKTCSDTPCTAPLCNDTITFSSTDENVKKCSSCTIDMKCTEEDACESTPLVVKQHSSE